MTYKLNPILEKITSPVILVFPGNECAEFRNGQAVVEQVFNEKYKIVSMSAVNSKVEIKLKLFVPFDGNESFF